MQILSATSAFPKHYHPQPAMEATLEQYWGAELPNRKVLRRLHAQAGVDGRHLALPVEEYAKLGALGLLAAMGPGFCSELVLLEW